MSWSNKQYVLDFIEQDVETALRYANNALKDDKDVVLAGVIKKGMTLKYANKDHQNDKEIVLAAVQQDAMSLQFASQELRNDKDVVLAGVIKKGIALKYANKDHQNDKEIVLAAVQQDAMSLQFASQELKNDKDIVVAAYNQNTDSLKYASLSLKAKVARAVFRKNNNITSPDTCSKETITPRTTHCYSCRKYSGLIYHLSTQIHNICGACMWISCPACGACGCGYYL